MICPAKSAYELHKSLNKSNLVIVNDAGHCEIEPGISDALFSIVEKYKDKIIKE